MDTASSYGKSEEFIGNFLKKNNHKFILCTKLRKSYSKNRLKFKDNIKESIFSSLKKLEVKKIDYFFIHNYEDMNTLASNELLKFKSRKVLKNIGASIYTINDYRKCLNLNFDILQIPFNFIDHRFLKIIRKDRKHKFFVDLFLRGNIQKILFLSPPKKFKELKKI